MGNVLSVSSAVHFLIGEMVLSRSKHQMCCEALRMKYGPAGKNVSGRVKSRCVHLLCGFYMWKYRGMGMDRERKRHKIWQMKVACVCNNTYTRVGE